jgi:hypothetical protein
MAETITHAFVSAKTQSPDTTLVSKNEWNDGHVFSGGSQGQILVYDNTQPNNMRWVDGAVNSGVSGGPVSGASPLTLIEGNITVTSLVAVYYSISAIVATSGSIGSTIAFRVDGVAVSNFNIAHATQTFFSLISSLPAGTHEISTVHTVGSGTFTSVTVAVQALTVGRI